MKDYLTVSWIIATKLAPFFQIKGYVRQEGLFQRLQKALDHRLTIISAPAGYGKTSLLSDLFASLKKSDVRVAWLTLDEEDSAPAHFLSYLFATLEAAGVTLPDYKSAAERSFQDISARAVVASILRSIELLDEPVVLIIDDYHRAAGKDLDNLFEWLLRFSPPRLHVLIASRDYPQVMQEDLRVRGALLEFTSRDLAFTPDDVRRAFEAGGAGEVAPQDILRLTDRTEGWPLAVALTIKWSLGEQKKTREVSEFSGRTRDLARYLSEQLLACFAADTQMFLLQTSILSRICGDLANSVTGRNDSWSVLEKLEQQNVFLTPLDLEGRWFRYHPLVAEFLGDRLRRLGQDVRELHHRAARWFDDHGLLSEALAHAAQSLDQDLVATLLERAGGWRLILDGRISLIRNYLPPPDSVQLASRPRLQLARTFLLIKCGDIDEAEAYFSSIRPALQNQTLSVDVQLEVQMVGNILSEYEDAPVTRGDIENTERLIRGLLPTHDTILLALANESLASQCYACGLLEESLEASSRATHYYREIGSLYGEVFTHFHQSLVKLAQGKLQEADLILSQLIGPVQGNFGPSSDLAANLAAFRAEILYAKNDIQSAHDLLSWALPHMETSDGWFDVYHSGYLTAAHCALRTHGLDSALSILERARAAADRRHLKRLRLAADLCEIELAVEAGHLARARDKADEIGLYDHAGRSGGESLMPRQLAFRLNITAARLNAALHRPSEHLAKLERLAQAEGFVRLLMEIRILEALESLAAGNRDLAASYLDQAISVALFEGDIRAFVRDGPRLLPLLGHLLSRESKLPTDRFRDGFVKEIQRLITVDNRLSEAAKAGYSLSARERDTLRILDTGLTNKEIAKQLQISPSTVKYRLKSLFRKLAVSSRKEAVKLARDRGWLGHDTVA